MRVRMTAILVVLALAAGVLGAGAAQASSAPIRMAFDKSAVAPGVWQGTVSGDVDGALTTELTGLWVSGPVWHVTFDWIIDAGPRSFTATLKGTLNTDTGAVVMNGTVVKGAWLGAQVHEEGQLVDPETSHFKGSIRIMPRSAG